MRQPRRLPLRTLTRILGRWRHDARGGIALSFAIAAPALLCVAGVAVDFANMFFMKSRLQAVADSAAISGAREMALANATPSQIGAAVASMIDHHAAEASGPITHSSAVDFRATEVTVDVEENWAPFFAHFVDRDATPIRAHAKAKLLHGTTKICVLALHPSGAKAVHLDKNAVITADDCGVYSNSTHTTSIQVDKSARIHAALNCAAGGVHTAKQGSIVAAPLTDCPPIEDPLRDRPPPDVGGCDFNKRKVVDQTVTLSPGVYCGGLEISGKSKVTLSGGTYVMLDGRLRIADEAAVEGEDVGFYLTGKDAVLDFSGDTTIRLSGPESGDMAGLLVYEDRAAKLGNAHLIRSANAEKLVGTIYLPRGRLQIDPNATVAEESAYTAIIARELSLTEGPNLVLNADYGATDVPVPAGIRASGTVVLAE